jgi:hypothetical protein
MPSFRNVGNKNVKCFIQTPLSTPRILVHPFTPMHPFQAHTRSGFACFCNWQIG